MTEQRVATLIVEVEGRQTNLESLLKRVHADLLKVKGEGERTSKSTDGLGGSQRRAADSALTHAQALARLSAAEGNTGSAVAQLEAALANQQRRTVQVINAETQLANLKGRLARETNGAKTSLQGLAQTAAGLGQALGAAGFAFGIQQIGQFAVAAAQQANELEKIQATLQITTGSQQRYAEVMGIAAANQRLFGGTLASNLTPLSAFVQLSNRSGAELQNLNNAAQLLLASNPAAAIGDASFALSEFLSSSGAEAALSLADRFNLDKKALTELAAAGTTAEQRLAGLEQLLAQQGITAEALNARLSTTAATYDQLGAAISNATTQLGSYISQALQPAALGLTALLTGNAEVEAALAQQASSIAAANGSYTEYAAAIQQANAAATRYNSEGIGPTITLLPSLSQAQYTYLQALLATGTSYQDAVTQAQAFGQELIILDDGTSQVIERTNALAEAELLLADNTRVAAEAAAADTAAKNEQANAAIAVEDSLLAQASATLEAEQRSIALGQAQQVLADLGSQVASGLITASDAALVLAQRYGIASGEAMRLIQLQATLARTQAVAAAGFAGVPEVYLGAATGTGTGLGPSNTILAQIATETKAAAATYNRAVADFEQAATGSSRSGGRGRSGGKGAGDKALEQQLAAEQRFQEQRLADQERINQQLQDAEAEHYENMLDIQAEFEERSLEQQRKNEISKRRTRESFYEALLGSDLDAATQQNLSAQYEAANAEAERMAQEGRQAQADEYRRLKAEQLQAEIEYQEKLAAAREKGDQEEIQKLEAIAALRRDREQAELNDLQQRGDENVNQRDEALADENERYAADQAEIAASAEEASRRQIEASERTQEARAREIAQIREQADALEALNRQRLAGTPANAPANEGTPSTAGAPIVPTPVDPVAIEAVGEAAGVAVGEIVAGGQAQLADLLGQVVGELRSVRSELGKLGQRKPLG